MDAGREVPHPGAHRRPNATTVRHPRSADAVRCPPPDPQVADNIDAALSICLDFREMGGGVPTSPRRLTGARPPAGHPSASHPQLVSPATVNDRNRSMASNVPPTRKTALMIRAVAKPTVPCMIGESVNRSATVVTYWLTDSTRVPR